MPIQFVKLEGSRGITPMIICDVCLDAIHKEGHVSHLWLGTPENTQITDSIWFMHTWCVERFEEKYKEAYKETFWEHVPDPKIYMPGEDMGTFLAQINRNFQNKPEKAIDVSRTYPSEIPEILNRLLSSWHVSELRNHHFED